MHYIKQVNMKLKVYYVCVLLFMLLEVKTFKPNHNNLYRLMLVKIQNASFSNTNLSWYNNTQELNGTWSSGNTPASRFTQWNLNNLNNSPQASRTTYRYDSDTTEYNSTEPSWSGLSSQLDNPVPVGNYYPENNPKDIDAKSKSSSWYQSDKANYQPSTYNRTNPPWKNPDDNYYQGNGHNYTLQVGGIPPNTTSHNLESNEYNTSKSATWNSPTEESYLGNEYLLSPDDIMPYRYNKKRSIRHYETRWSLSIGSKRKNRISNGKSTYRQPIQLSQSHHGFPPEYIPQPKYTSPTQYIPPIYDWQYPQYPSPYFGQGGPPQFIPNRQSSDLGGQVGSQNNYGNGDQINIIQYPNWYPNNYPVYTTTKKPNKKKG